METIDRYSHDIILDLEQDDVIKVGTRSVRVVRPHDGWIRHCAWVRFDGERPDCLVPIDNVRDVFRDLQPGAWFKYPTNGMSGIFLGELQYREASIRTTTVLEGAPKKSDIDYTTLVHFKAGDRKAFKKHVLSMKGVVDAEKMKVTQAPDPGIPIGYFLTKWDLIPYVVAVNGPMPREEILKQVQRLQGRPYVPGSNKSYFMDDRRDMRPARLGAVTRKILKVDHKRGNTLVYGLGSEGKKLAAKVIACLGEEPGKAV